MSRLTARFERSVPGYVYIASLQGLSVEEQTIITARTRGTSVEQEERK